MALNRYRISSAGPGLLLAMVLWAAAAATCHAQTSVQVTALAGEVRYRASDEAPIQTLTGSAAVPADGTVVTGPDGLAQIRYADGSEVSVKPNSSVKVGGGKGEGPWVRLGRIVVRVQRMLSSEEPTEVRTPIAVAAVRGTEFGVFVDETTRTEVFVFEGTVGVSNVQIPGQEVMVRKGQMTTVVPLRPPSAPAPFSSGEFDRLGQLNRLERGEDPVLESTEEPASEAYLAFPDVEIDAVRNPAFMGASSSTSSTTLVSAYGSRRSERLEAAGASSNLSRFSTRGALGQHVSVWRASSAWRAGVALDGDVATDDATVMERAPMTLVTNQIQRATDRRKGKVEAMAAWTGGRNAIGLAGSYHRSRIEVTDRLLTSGGPGDLTTTRNRVAAVQAGLLHRGGRDRSLAVGYTHEFLKSTADAGTLHLATSGHNNVAECLYRAPLGTHRGAGMFRMEHVKTGEDVTDGETAVYHEDRSVWSAKGGGGIGITPSRDLLIGVDLVGGYSTEKATQYLPDGGIREDEDDVRYSLNLHVGAQAMLSRWLLLSVDVNNQAERLTKDFLLLPGTASESKERDIRTLYRTTASSGISLVRPGYALQYYAASGVASESPISHHLLLVVDLP